MLGTTPGIATPDYHEYGAPISINFLNVDTNTI